MRIVRTLLIAMLAASARQAVAGTGPEDACVSPDIQTPTISAAALTSNRSFTIDQPGAVQPTGAYRTAEIYVDLVDANTSITTLHLACTGGYQGSSGVYTQKTCTSSGTCSSVGAWDFTSPASSSWHFPIDIKGVQNALCTWSVTGGSAASIDTITVRRRLCVQ